jgi:hypothetical protein
MFKENIPDDLKPFYIIFEKNSFEYVCEPIHYEDFLESYCSSCKNEENCELTKKVRESPDSILLDNKLLFLLNVEEPLDYYGHLVEIISCMDYKNSQNSFKDFNLGIEDYLLKFSELVKSERSKKA